VTPALEHIVELAQSEGATIVRIPAATIVVIPVATGRDPDELVPLADAVRIAATSLRVMRDAIRRGELPAHGRQRDRAVRLRDLDAWIESRRAPVHAGPDDLDVERRMSRIARRRRRAA
jgi:hypothetical protein